MAESFTRQPVLDAGHVVAGFEILFRSVAHGHGDSAARDTEFAGCDLATVANGKPAFVRLERGPLVRRAWKLLTPETAVIELARTVSADADVLAACDQLKRRGFRLAARADHGGHRHPQLGALADILRIGAASLAKVGSCIENADGKTVLADGLATRAMFHDAVSLGCTRFQGSYFREPLASGPTAPRNRQQSVIRLVSGLLRTEPGFEQLGAVLGSDAALTAELLRLVHRPEVGLGRETRSVQQAMISLGEARLRKWGLVAALLGLCTPAHASWVTSCLVRGRLGEELATRVAGVDEEDAFAAGLLHGLPALLARPMAEVLELIRPPRPLRAALLGEPTALGAVTALAAAHEAADWPRLQTLEQELGLDPQATSRAYPQAIRWADALAGCVDPTASPDPIQVAAGRGRPFSRQP